jgi:hypothetical protein
MRSQVKRAAFLLEERLVSIWNKGGDLLAATLVGELFLGVSYGQVAHEGALGVGAHGLP